MPAMQSTDGRGGQDRAGSKRDWIDRLRMPRLRVRDKRALAAEGAPREMTPARQEPDHDLLPQGRRHLRGRV
jgi:hypothetical protein